MDKIGTVSWASSPNQRGTVDLLWSCLLVVFTAVWTVIHLNLPAKDDSSRRVFARKMRWAITAILAPDMVTLISASQWKSARDSVLDMHNLGHKTWTLEHAFYANGGGLWIKPTDYPPFPANAASIHYLVKGNYISCPSITKEEIWDKSKADVFAKGFALVQSVWLILQSIARTAQGLPISPLELFTIAFVVSTMMSYFFWLHKPQNVTVPTVLQLNSADGAISTVLREAGPEAICPFVDTPFDFIEKPLQNWKRRPMLQYFDLRQRPLQRLPNDTITPGKKASMGWWEMALIVGPSVVHSTIHIIGWYFEYPTRIEQHLWRAASVVLASGAFISVGVVSLLNAIGFRGQECLVWVWVKPELKQKGWKNQIIEVCGVFVTCCMVVARLCIIGEVLASLRALPKDVYRTVNWTGFIPHV